MPDKEMIRAALPRLPHLFEQLTGQKPIRHTARYSQYFAPHRNDGRHASFTIYDDYFIDYGGSNDKGDVFKLIGLLHGTQDFGQQVRIALDLIGHVPTPIIKPAPKPTKPDNPIPDALWQQKHRRIVQSAHENLLNNPAMLEHVMGWRGFTQETIQKYRIGYLENFEIWDHQRKQYDYAAVITIPGFYADDLHAVRVRFLDSALVEKYGKYRSFAGSKLGQLLVNGDRLAQLANSEKPKVVIVEGEFDAFLAQQILGDDFACVTRGGVSSATLPENIKNRIAAHDEIYILMDSDSAGQNARDNLLEQLPHAMTLDLPHGHDVTDYVKSGGDLRELLQSAKTKEGLWWLQHTDGWREAVHLAMPQSVAWMMEAFTQVCLQKNVNSACFSIQDFVTQAQTLGHNLTYSKVNRLIKQLDGVFFTKSDTDNPQNSVSETGKNVGRKKNYYRLLDRDTAIVRLKAWLWPRIVEREFSKTSDERELLIKFSPKMLEVLNLDEPTEALANTLNSLLVDYHFENHKRYHFALKRVHARFQAMVTALDTAPSTPLPQGYILHKASDYKALYARVVVEGEPETRRSGKEWSYKLGVPRTGVGKILSKAGLINEAQHEIVEIDTEANVMYQAQQSAFDVKGFAQTVIIENEATGHIREYAYTEEAIEYVSHKLDPECENLKIRYQVASCARVAADPFSVTGYADHDRKPTTPLKRSTAERRWKTTPKRSKKAHYGASYDPQFVMQMLRLAVYEVVRRHDGVFILHGEQVVHRGTGEVIDISIAQNVLNVLLSFALRED